MASLNLPPSSAVHCPGDRPKDISPSAHVGCVSRHQSRKFSAVNYIKRYQGRGKKLGQSHTSCTSSSRAVGKKHFANSFSKICLMLPRASNSSDVGSQKSTAAAVDRAIIVGGGLGGLAAAIALRNQGIDAQVYEKYTEISGGEGTMISLFPNGLWALSCSAPSLPQKLANYGNVDPVCPNYSPDGILLGRWDLAEKMSAAYGYPMIAIRWSTVLKELKDLLPLECIHTNHELVGLEQEEDKVKARFKVGDGEEVVETPLLIGADGIRSHVRTLLFDEIPPNDNARGIWRAMIPRDRCHHSLIHPGHISAMVGEGRTAIISDAGEDRLYWSYTVTDAFRNDPPGGRRSLDAEESKSRLEADFEGWELAQYVLQKTEASEILERRVLNLNPLKRWGVGRVQLIGDAAHALTPALGQGANLAFEDGLELANHLVAHPSLRDALSAFEAARIPRATCIARGGEGMSDLVKSGAGDVEPPRFYDFIYGYRGVKEKLQRSDSFYNA